MGIKGGKLFLSLAFLFSTVFFARGSSAEASILFSEVCWMGSAESSSDEWLELYNASAENISLDGWILNDAAGKLIIPLAGAIPAGGYFLLERTDDGSVSDIAADLIYSGSLANDGGVLELRDNDDVLIDKIEASGGWPAGDNEKKETMQFSGEIWITGAPTPRRASENSLTPEASATEIDLPANEAEERTERPAPAKAAKIVLNEIYPDPAGSDRKKEFIELYNAGEEAVDLSGWRLESGGRNYKFGRLDILFAVPPGKIIKAGEYLAVFREQSGLVLGNSGGSVKLFKPDKKAAESSLDYGPAIEGYAYADTSHIDLALINTSTKDFFLNSPLAGYWVWTAQISPGADNRIKTPNTIPRAIFSAPAAAEAKKEIFFDASDTIDEDGDVLEFSWDFGDGVALEMEEARHTFLKSGEYEVKLVVSDGRKSDVFSRLISISGSKSEVSAAPAELGVKEDFWYEEYLPDEYYSGGKTTVETEMTVPVSILAARTQNGSLVEIEGIVSAEPGVLGTQFFYLSDASSGIRVYNYKKDFPVLKEGDLLRARGEIAELRGETTLKIADANALEILASGRELKALEASSEEIVPENVGRLLEIRGKVLKKSSPRIFLSDGLDEITAYLKTGADIDTAALAPGTELALTGILGIVSGELVIFPRASSDLEVVASATVLAETVKEEIVEKEWFLPERNNKGELLKYLISSLLVLAVIGSIYLYQKRRRTP